MIFYSPGVRPVEDGSSIVMVNHGLMLLDFSFDEEKQDLEIHTFDQLVCFENT